MAVKPYHTPNMQSYVASADLSAKQYTFVKVHTVTNQVAAVSSASDIPLGILMNQPTSGQEAEVAMPGGGAKLICDASVIQGSFISTGADGKGELATLASGVYVAAIADAIGTTTTADDAIPVIVAAFSADRDAEDLITTRGDIIRGSSAALAERLALGASGTVLASDGTDAAYSFVAAAQCNVTAGTAEASKPMVLDGSKQIDTLDVSDNLKMGGVEVPAACSFSYASAAANVSEVTVTVLGADGLILAGVWTLVLHLSDAATGVGLTGTAASGTVNAKAASGTDHAALTAKKSLLVQTLAAGTYILEITDSSKTGYYPSASVTGSGALSIGAQMVSGDYGA